MASSHVSLTIERDIPPGDDEVLGMLGDMIDIEESSSEPLSGGSEMFMGRGPHVVEAPANAAVTFVARDVVDGKTYETDRVTVHTGGEGTTASATLTFHVGGSTDAGPDGGSGKDGGTGGSGPVRTGSYQSDFGCGIDRVEVTSSSTASIIMDVPDNGVVTFRRTADKTYAASNLTILGAPGHEVTLRVTGMGSFVLDANDGSGGSCTSTFNRITVNKCMTSHAYNPIDMGFESMTFEYEDVVVGSKPRCDIVFTGGGTTGSLLLALQMGLQPAVNTASVTMLLRESGSWTFVDASAGTLVPNPGVSWQLFGVPGNTPVVMNFTYNDGSAEIPYRGVVTFGAASVSMEFGPK